MDNSKWGLLRHIPGFRTGRFYKGLIAIIGYFFMTFATIEYTIACSATLKTGMLEFISAITIVWIGPLLMANVASWSDRVPIIKHLPRILIIFLRFFVLILVFALGLKLDNYVRYTLLNLPKN